MSQMPRGYRKQLLENKLSYVLRNPLADQSDVNAARKAVEATLDRQDIEFRNSQRQQTDRYMSELAAASPQQKDTK